MDELLERLISGEPLNKTELSNILTDDISTRFDEIDSLNLFPRENLMKKINYINDLFLEAEKGLYSKNNKLTSLYQYTMDITKNRLEQMIVRKILVDLFREDIEKKLNTVSATIVGREKLFQQLDLLTKEQEQVEKDLVKSSNGRIRRANEIALDVCRRALEDITRELENNNVEIGSPYSSYPELYDSEFNSKLMAKKEFQLSKIPVMTDQNQKIDSKKSFQKSMTQKFVKNYISEYTPYNGILLWHEVGVGKTCAGVSIAENFRNFIQSNDKKILVLTPSETLEETWRDEIFNIGKETDKLRNTSGCASNINVQCTGSRYVNELPKLDGLNPDRIKREVNRVVNKYYEFMGYQKLANTIKKELEKELSIKKNKQKATIEYIKKRFSNIVIIMDEVHETREGGAGTESEEKRKKNIKREERNDKVARPYLELIARYAENTKLILATATPMYNISKEIVWLLNLLLWNDKRGPIEDDELFDRDGLEIRDQKALELLVEKSRGYISYLRGENPFSFPIKLEPVSLNAYIPEPKYIVDGGKKVELEESESIKNLVFYKNECSPWQYKTLQQFILSMENSSDELAEEGEEIPEEEEDDSSELTTKRKGGFSHSKTSQASNIVFPSRMEQEGLFGRKGFRECLLENKREKDGITKYTYADHVKNINGYAFLHMKNLATYSSKFYNIIESIKSCKGISFVYSQFVDAGVKSLAMALEENGFTRYTGEGKTENFLEEHGQSKNRFCAKHLKYFSELTDEEKKHFVPAQYIYLDGSVPKTRLNILRNEVNGLKLQQQYLNKELHQSFLDGEPDINKNGEHIKIILGSGVVEQGISFFCVREIHILDPWHHLNTMEQAAGRGIRRFSHRFLEEAYRNVTLYMHIAAPPSSDSTYREIESPDERVYRRAFLKKVKMALIERSLKRNAIDCGLNLYGNLFLEDFYDQIGDKSLSNRQIVDSKGNSRTISLYDKDYSMRCNFDKCLYSCLPKENSGIELSNDTFNDFFAEDDILLIKEYIKNMFLLEYVYSEEDILESMSKLGVQSSSDFIFKALDEIVTNKETIYDGFYRPGIIIDRYGKYIFQPRELDDTNAPMLYRYIPNYSVQTKISLDKEYPSLLNIYKQQQQQQVAKKIIAKPKPNLVPVDSKKQSIVELNSLLSISEKEINTRYQEYPTDNSDIPNIPTRTQLGYYLFLSKLEKLSYEKRTQYLLDVLPDIVEEESKNNRVNRLHMAILYLYDTPRLNKYIIRQKRDLGRGDSNNIVAFQTYDIKKNHYYYSYREDSGQFQKKNELTEKEIELGFDLEKTADTTKSILFGYIDNHNIDRLFYIINKNDGTYELKYNNDGSIQKKSLRRGGICGTAKGAKDRPELAKIINELYGSAKYNTNTRSGLESKESLCEEIELLLRHHDYYSPNVNLESRYFYRVEEHYLQKDL